MKNTQLNHFLEKAKNEIINTIKVLIYKEDTKILERLDFENDNTFLEPLVFAYFNSKNDNVLPKQLLKELLQGYCLKASKTEIEYAFNTKGIAYLPKMGYFRKEDIVPFDNITFIPNTNIEIITHQIENLEFIFSRFENLELTPSLFNFYKEPLTKAFSYIKSSSAHHYTLIEECCKKIVLFNTDPKNTNSFATINAHGIAFFNVYQKEYDEVFFIDDIAHQTGHIILTTLTFKRKDYFLIDENKYIKDIVNSATEYRSFYTLFHALYTYYTTTLCLDNCLSNHYFDKRQRHEAIGRIGFYLRKYSFDIDNFKKVTNHYKGIEMVFTKKGIFIFQMVYDMYLKMHQKYNFVTKEFSYSNQPYNFTYANFIKLNPMKL